MIYILGILTGIVVATITLATLLYRKGILKSTLTKLGIIKVKKGK